MVGFLIAGHIFLYLRFLAIKKEKLVIVFIFDGDRGEGKIVLLKIQNTTPTS